MDENTQTFKHVNRKRLLDKDGETVCTRNIYTRYRKRRQVLKTMTIVENFGSQWLLLNIVDIPAVY